MVGLRVEYSSDIYTVNKVCRVSDTDPHTQRVTGLVRYGPGSVPVYSFVSSPAPAAASSPSVAAASAAAAMRSANDSLPKRENANTAFAASRCA